MRVCSEGDGDYILPWQSLLIGRPVILDVPLDITGDGKSSILPQKKPCTGHGTTNRGWPSFERTMEQSCTMSEL
jgi:hypothetical protein